MENIIKATRNAILNMSLEKSMERESFIEESVKSLIGQEVSHDDIANFVLENNHNISFHTTTYGKFGLSEKWELTIFKNKFFRTFEVSIKIF